MKLFESRSAITPLVATILLVAFSIGLGALVMSWGEDYIEHKAEFAQGTAEIRSACDMAHIEVIKISGAPQACFGPDGIMVWLDNGADVDLFNIHARIVGSNNVGVVESILSDPLLKSNAVRTTIPYDRTLGSLLQLKLTPKIWSGKEVSMCTKAAITLENLAAC